MASHFALRSLAYALGGLLFFTNVGASCYLAWFTHIHLYTFFDSRRMGMDALVARLVFAYLCVRIATAILLAIAVLAPTRDGNRDSPEERVVQDRMSRNSYILMLCSLTITVLSCGVAVIVVSWRWWTFLAAEDGVDYMARHVRILGEMEIVTFLITMATVIGTLRSDGLRDGGDKVKVS